MTEAPSSPPNARVKFAGLGELPANVDVRLEVRRWSFTKHRPDGSVDFVSPLPTPYDYGSIEGTVAPDGDPYDAVLLGGGRERGELYRVRIRAVLGFIDDGQLDPKVICSEREPTWAQLRGIELFFSTYALFKRGLYLRRGAKGPTRRGRWLAREI